MWVLPVVFGAIAIGAVAAKYLTEWQIGRWSQRVHDLELLPTQWKFPDDQGVHSCLDFFVDGERLSAGLGPITTPLWISLPDKYADMSLDVALRMAGAVDCHSVSDVVVYQHPDPGWNDPSIGVRVEFLDDRVRWSGWHWIWPEETDESLWSGLEELEFWMHDLTFDRPKYDATLKKAIVMLRRGRTE